MHQLLIQPVDLQMMRRCIDLSREAAEAGEIPFASLICRRGEIVAEATNRVVRDKDVTRHAELIAIGEAQKALGTRVLSDCTIYSNIEPCPMCAFPVRETQIARVVFAIKSPRMGGLSKWNILRDSEISEVMPEAFGNVPEVVAGVLAREAEQVWKSWNPIAWSVIRLRGCFEADDGTEFVQFERLEGVRRRSLFRSLLALHR